MHFFSHAEDILLFMPAMKNYLPPSVPCSDSGQAILFMIVFHERSKITITRRNKVLQQSIFNILIFLISEKGELYNSRHI